MTTDKAVKQSKSKKSKKEKEPTTTPETTVQAVTLAMQRARDQLLSRQHLPPDKAEHGIKKALVRAILEDRRDAVYENSTLINTDPWTLSTVWYLWERYWKQLGRILPEGKEKDNLRRIIQDEYVLDICRYEWDITRDSIGIYVAPRGVLYYAGKAHVVTLDNAEELGQFGTDLIFIEKGSPARALSKLSVHNGIAILSSEGFAVEAHQILSKYARESGAKVSWIHDLDGSGIMMAMKTPDIADLGVDFEMLEELDIDLADVEQTATESGHWKWLRDNLPEDHPMRQHLDWLRYNKAEIDHVIGRAKPRKFWFEGVLPRLAKKHPDRNYTRAYDVEKEYTEPDFMTKLNDTVTDALANATQRLDQKIIKQIEKVDGKILDIRKLKKAIHQKRIWQYNSFDQFDELERKVYDVITWIDEQDWVLEDPNEDPEGISLDDAEAEDDGAASAGDDVEKEEEE